MSETQAQVIAEAFGGEVWNSGGGIWVVKLDTENGNLVVISDDLVCEYRDEEAFRAGEMIRSISLV